MTYADLEVDPFTFEIVRHKLFRVTEEAILALESVSGTAITAEAHDLMVSVYRPDGSLMVGGVGFLQHMTSASQAVKHIIELYSEDPGIGQDDVYLMNDPYSGALHASDAYLIAPIHHAGQLAGFVAAFVHLADIGGIDPGGFCPRATVAFQEGFATRGLRLVEGGKLRRDAFETLLNVVRDPDLVGLDLRSLMAACHVAKDRMRSLYEEYGPDTVDRVGAQLIELTESMMRKRLREMPDGTWRSRQYYEQPSGEPLRVVLEATKEGESLLFDFTGTSPQVQNPINCSYWASWGSVFAPILPVLAWDMVWNEGLFPPVRMVAPEGTLVNARRPAPVSLATVGVIQLVRNSTLHVLSKMVGASERLWRRAIGTWAPTIMHYTLIHESGSETVTHHGTDTFVGAGGARAYQDGIDVGGVFHAPANRCANVERHETLFPHMYLYRRIVPDSGGPGKYRGGASHEFAITPSGSNRQGFEAVLMPGRGIQAPMSQGVFGGYPGCNTASIQFREANATELPARREDMKGAREDTVSTGLVSIDPGDMQYIRYDGGGGYGDPLERDPELVLDDVMTGVVTAAAAREVYGVILEEESGTVDGVATEERRREVRAERLGRDVGMIAEGVPVDRTTRRLGEYLQIANIDGAEVVQCTWCGTSVCDRNEQWKDHAIRRSSFPAQAGPLRVDTGEFKLVEYFCPGCATVIDIDTVWNRDPPLYDTVSWWPES